MTEQQNHLHPREGNTRRQKVRRAGVGTGTTSLLMIFTVLCFATLAMLSLSTANSDRRIQARGYERVADMTAAEGRAAEKLADIDAVLAQARGAGGERAYYAALESQAAPLGYTVDPDSATLLFSVEIDAESELVTLLSLFPSGGGRRYAIQTQASRMTDEWVPEPSGQLWEPKASAD